MRRLYGLIGVALLLPFSAVSKQGGQTPQPIQSQPAGPTNAPPPAPRGADRQITLDVQVTDKSGAPIRGLQQEDFAVLDDKFPRKIISFQAVNSATPAATDPPVEITLIIDAVNAPVLAVSYERDKIRKFLLQNSGALLHPVSLVLLTDEGTKVLKESTRDGNALAAAYDQYQTGLRTITRNQGYSGAQERFVLSLTAFISLATYEGARPGRKLLIWISPGWPLLSSVNYQLSSKNKQKLFDTIVGESSELSRARITPYTIDPLLLADTRADQYFKQFVKGVSSPSQTVPSNLALPVFAVQNGGRVITSSNDLTTAISSCASDGDDYYALTFSAAPADQPNEYHSLEVKVDKPGTEVRTRTGYYAQP